MMLHLLPLGQPGGTPWGSLSRPIREGFPQAECLLHLAVFGCSCSYGYSIKKWEGEFLFSKIWDSPLENSIFFNVYNTKRTVLKC